MFERGGFGMMLARRSSPPFLFDELFELFGENARIISIFARWTRGTGFILTMAASSTIGPRLKTPTGK